MQSTRLYISGPMKGLPAFNYPAFHAAAAAVRALGHDVVNPAEHFNGQTDLPWATYIRKDLETLLTCDGIVLLPGWRNSRGACLEQRVAEALGLRQYRWEADTLVPDGVAPETVLEEAQRLVFGPRQAAYGHPIQDFTRTGRLWGAILGLPDIDPRICCLMMAAVKISREVNAGGRDNRTDGAGYFACAQLVAEAQDRAAGGAT